MTCEKHELLEATIVQINDKLDVLSVSSKNVESAIIGDFKEKGLRGRIEDLEAQALENKQFITDLKSKFSNIAWKAITLAIGTGGSAVGISKLLEAFLK